MPGSKYSHDEQVAYATGVSDTFARVFKAIADSADLSTALDRLRAEWELAQASMNARGLF